MFRIEDATKEKIMYDIGEKPGKGTYCCTNCDWSVTLDDDDDRLPPCGKCGKGQDTTYNRC
jgi:ribosomal protein S27AE